MGMDTGSDKKNGIRIVRTDGVVLMTDNELHDELEKDEMTIRIDRKAVEAGGIFEISSTQKGKSHGNETNSK